MKKQPAPYEHIKPANRRVFFWTAVALFHIVLLGYLAHLHFTVITHIKNGEFFMGSYRFSPIAGTKNSESRIDKFLEEDFSHPRLQLLRKRENLDIGATR